MTGCSLASPHLVDISVFATPGSQSSGENKYPAARAETIFA
jgi:hypothetical protein